jgi:hypothetical protein
MKYIALIFLMNVIYGQDELDLDVMWENTIWEEIEEVTTKEFEVEKVTDVAGVRGAEAEDEALEHLYYRKSMKGLSKLDLQRALGKLILKKEKLDKMKNRDSDSEKLDKYITQLKIKLKIIKS